jgi:cobalt-zinc-cadmium efflux system membrane fusion protein
MNPVARLLASTLLLAAMPPQAQETIHLDAASMNRAGILVRPVLERTFGQQVPIFGEVVRSPGTTLTVKTPVDGRVLDLLVSPGDPVRKGEPLIVIHSHDVHSLQSELLTRREELRLARSREDAGEKLYALEGISRIELEQRNQEALAAGMRYELARHELEDLGFRDRELAAMEQAHTVDGKLTVRAPADAVVLEMGVQRHQRTQTFEPLMVLGDPGKLELRVRISPSDASRVGIGDRIEFVPVGRPEASGAARVLTPIPTVDPETRTVAVRAEIVSTSESLFPGVFIEGMLTHGASSSSLSVPESAVIRIGGSDYVFVSLPRPGTFEARVVELGRFNGTRYEIEQGLALEERVAVQGVFFLKSALLQGRDEE